ncbi:SDR family NAD(P)-dependent oxidoreductase [Enterobacter hormaechei]
MELDITDAQEVERVLATLPTPDILVNSAGLARHQPFLEVNEDNFDAVMTLTCAPPFCQPARGAQNAGGQ